jgi:TRAP-type C4-dicarboxylate transport system substrate-binding protein
MLRSALIGILLVALVASVTGCGGGEATPTNGAGPTPDVKPITLKLISSYTADGVGGQTHDLFAELVEEYTGGRVLVDVYPGSQLFPATEQWEALTSGAVDIVGEATYYFRDVVPDVLAFYIEGVLFEGREHLYAVLEESQVPQMLADRFEEAGPVKVLGFAPTTMGGCLLNTVRETEHMADLKGLRTQSLPGAPPLPLYEYTGMAAVPIPFEEVTTAFVQGIIDAVHYPPVTMTDLRLHEVGKHGLFRDAWAPTTVIMANENSWQRLPVELQEIIVNQVMPQVYEFQKNSYREAEEAAVRELEEELETFHWVTEEDLDAYLEYLPTHATVKVQMLMVDPKIVDVIADLWPDNG